MRVDIYIDNSPNVSVIGVYIKDSKIVSIKNVSYVPITEDLYIKDLDLPTRQQLHSKVNYMKRKYKLIANVDGGTFIDEAKKIIQERHPYAHIIK